MNTEVSSPMYYEENPIGPLLSNDDIQLEDPQAERQFRQQPLQPQSQQASAHRRKLEISEMRVLDLVPPASESINTTQPLFPQRQVEYFELQASQYRHYTFKSGEDSAWKFLKGIVGILFFVIGFDAFLLGVNGLAEIGISIFLLAAKDLFVLGVCIYQFHLGLTGRLYRTTLSAHNQTIYVDQQRSTYKRFPIAYNEYRMSEIKYQDLLDVVLVKVSRTRSGSEECFLALEWTEHGQPRITQIATTEIVPSYRKYQFDGDMKAKVLAMKQEIVSKMTRPATGLMSARNIYQRQYI